MTHSKFKEKMINRSQTTRLDLALISLIVDLKLLREHLKLSQLSVALNTDMALQEIVDFENYNERPKLAVIEKIEAYLQAENMKVSQ